MLPRRYHPALRVLHWLIAILIIAALILGTFVMAPKDNTDPGKIFALLKHMAAGGIILALSLMRIFIRPKTRRPAPMLSGIAVADRIVPLVHRIFDVLVLVMVGSGIGMAVLAGLPEVLFGGHASLPASFDNVPLHTLHVMAAKVFAGIIALHVVGAFYHHFILRDGLLSRMSLALGKSQNG